jgi:outer membrane lipoprotein SlyB
MKKLFLLFLVPLMFIFSGCNYAGMYSSVDYGKIETIRKGIIVGISDVDTRYDDMVVGGFLGTALGMAMGTSQGSTLGLGLTGATIGSLTHKTSVEHIVVRLENGQEIAFLHKKIPTKRLFAGDPVRVHFDDEGVVKDVTYAYGTITRYKVLR